MKCRKYHVDAISTATNSQASFHLSFLLIGGGRPSSELKSLQGRGALKLKNAIFRMTTQG